VDLIIDAFKRSKCKAVIIPFMILRRIDCVLEPTKEEVIKRYKTLKGQLDDLDKPLSCIS
jgi:type I restriction enzyme M protein